MNDYIKKKILVVEEETEIYSSTIRSSKESADFFRQFYKDDIEIYESFYLLLLNRSNMIDACIKISQGGIVGTVVDVKLIAKYALDSLSSAVILCHNHPSGKLQPSTADKKITNTVINALELFDIEVLDHIILTKNEYYSFRDEGLIF